jgi:hypothetical protein
MAMAMVPAPGFEGWGWSSEDKKSRNRAIFKKMVTIDCYNDDDCNDNDYDDDDDDNDGGDDDKDKDDKDQKDQKNEKDLKK